MYLNDDLVDPEIDAGGTGAALDVAGPGIGSVLLIAFGTVVVVGDFKVDNDLSVTIQIHLRHSDRFSCTLLKGPDCSSLSRSI
jgi:hypothetical protein